ncbi:DNA-binding transcriptional LysR family regulator [Parapusillimonas granuli]|uniref:LysR family transcriptional regulator n=1 Tax=Parapusillimonas granuli TaxID=380911 RepID=A0A853G0D5_9BURK|nr:DNA-binding transcriptional LysR family regulator [Parapusillimonas granuli]NYT48291.1 LysR family transcriptional regulator [Parapusillimonas granuli]
MALHQFGTVAAAARAVHLSPAAVSVQLRNLEDELDVELFIRTGRSISLNDRAHQLVPLARRMLDLQSEMASLGNSRSLKGKMALGIITSTLTGGLPGVLKRLGAEHPQLELRITAKRSPDLATLVEAGLLDAAIISRPPPNIPTSLCFQALYREPLALVMSAQRNFTNIKDALEEQPYIAFDKTTWIGKQIESFIETSGLSVRPVMELDSHDAVLSIVRHDIGVTILPVLKGHPRKDPSLRFMDLPSIHREVCLAVRHANKDSRATQVLVNYFREFGNSAPLTK